MNRSTDIRTVRLQGSGGLSLAADDTGPPSGATVVLLHGGGQNRFAWRGTAARLAGRGYRVVSVDARGHGDSDWSDAADYDMDHFAADLLAVLEALPERPAVVGASMGGISALLAQSAQPHRQLFSAVVLVDVTPQMEPEGVARIMSFMTAHPDGFPSLDAAADAIAAYNPHRARPENSEGLRRVLRERPDGRWVWHWDVRFLTDKVGAEDPDALGERMETMATQLHDAAALLSVPTLLVRGLLSDLVSDRTVAAFRDAVPHADFVEIDRAGHMVAGDRNDDFAAAVVEFLDRHVDRSG